MSPLFACSGCGVQIERSARLYRQLKGQVLCSSCKDRLEAGPAGEVNPVAPPAGGPGAGRRRPDL